MALWLTRRSPGAPSVWGCVAAFGLAASVTAMPGCGRRDHGGWSNTPTFDPSRYQGTSPVVATPPRAAASDSPEDVCAHLVGITRDEVASSLGTVSPEERARVQADFDREMRGIAGQCHAEMATMQRDDPHTYERLSACYLRASDIATAERCEERAPVHVAHTPALVCGHVIDLVMREVGATLSDLAADQRAVLEQEVKNSLGKCVEELTKAQQEDPARFDRTASCVLGASTLDAAGKCEQP